MKIVVVADDMTGAAEIAGSALRVGLSAEVQVGALQPSEATVVVVDADSRSLSPERAASRVAELTRQVLAFAPDFVFKKVDSLLRGPVLAELQAMQRGAGLRQCMLVCANPRKQRTISQGILRIAGQLLHKTSLAADPEHPRSSSRVLELLCPGRLTPGTACLIAPGATGDATVWLGDVASADDLAAHAQTWFVNRISTLAAGSSEFFEAFVRVITGDVARLCSKPSTVPAALTVPRATLLVSGSRWSQVDNWPLLENRAYLSPSEGAWEVCRLLAVHGRAAIRAVDLQAGTPHERLQCILELAGKVFACCRPSTIWIEGGQTASSLIRYLGYQRLTAVANLGDGVVALEADQDLAPLLLIKPGSYSWNLASELLPVGNTATPIQESA